MTAVSKHVAMTELRAPWFDSLASHTKANATVTCQLPRQERRCPSERMAEAAAWPARAAGRLEVWAVGGYYKDRLRP